MTDPVAPLDVAGRYVLGGVVGEGGMARVRLGSLVGTSGFRRLVAVKQAIAAADDPKARHALAEEARLAARINHVNVVSILDVLELPDDVLIVLDWIDGVSLSRLALGDGQRLSIPVAAGIVADMLAGLDAAHEARSDGGAIHPILHRDVSPENVLVGRDGVARLTDFGIARLLGAEHRTQAGKVRGKAGYLAPEVLRGEPATVQSDLYSAAVVAWEVFAGRRLYTAKNPAKLWIDVMNAREAPDLRSVRDDVPEEIATALGEALARDPARRPASALALAARLEGGIARASPASIGAVVETIASEDLERRADLARALEHSAIPADAAATELRATPRAAPQPPPSEPRPSKPSKPEPARAGIPIALTLAIAASVVVLGLCVIGVVGRPPAADVAPPVTASTASAAATSVSTVAAEPSARASALPPEPSASAKALVTRARTPPQARSAPVIPRPPSCDPPYDVDDAGHRRYKLECVR